MSGPGKWSLTYKSDNTSQDWFGIRRLEEKESKNFSKQCQLDYAAAKVGKKGFSEDFRRFQNDCKLLYLFPDLDSSKFVRAHQKKTLTEPKKRELPRSNSFPVKK